MQKPWMNMREAFGPLYDLLSCKIADSDILTDWRSRNAHLREAFQPVSLIWFADSADYSAGFR